MPRKIKVPEGVSQIALTDGRVYTGEVEVVLTDDEFENLAPSLLDSGKVVDLGEVPPPGYARVIKSVTPPEDTEAVWVVLPS